MGTMEGVKREALLELLGEALEGGLRVVGEPLRLVLQEVLVHRNHRAVSSRLLSFRGQVVLERAQEVGELPARVVAGVEDHLLPVLGPRAAEIARGIRYSRYSITSTIGLTSTCPTCLIAVMVQSFAFPG
jgi:hypothetical protein